MSQQRKKVITLFQKTEFMLADSFRATGKWWLSNKKRQKVHGTLSYAHTDTELELSGAFEKVDSADLATLGQKFADHPCIHGQSDEGKTFSLLKSFVLQYGSSTKYCPLYIIAGMHTPPPSKLRISSLSFYCSYLDTLIARTLFGTTDDYEGDDFKGATITYVQPKKVSWRIPSIAATLEFDAQTKLHSGRMSAEIYARSYVTILPDEPQDLDWFLTTVWRLCYLFTLLSDERVSPTGIEIFVNGKEYPCWLLYKASEGYLEDQDVIPVFLFHLSHVVNDFATILDRWCSVDDTLLDAIHLTMDAHRDPHQTGQGRFLLLAHAAEVFSRATTPSEYLPPHEYEEVRKALTEAIPATVHRDLRSSLRSRIDFGNEYAFHKRVRLLTESLSKPAQEIVCRNTESFARGVSDTRNYYTHFTNKLRPKALPPAAMYWASEKLLILMRIVLLKYLGIDEGLIVAQLKKHHRLTQRIYLSKEHPESMKG